MEKKRERIGFFGASFDPIHIGHMNMAIQLLEKCDLDKILFCPAHISPGKVDTPPEALKNHRLNMVQLATEDHPAFIPIDQEVSRPSPSYTIDTVESLGYKEAELFLIIGEDAAYHLMEWKEIEKLLNIASPLIGRRFGLDASKINAFKPSIRKKVLDGYISTKTMEISSTTIRKRLKKRLYCAHLLPSKILDYIYQNGLYCDGK